MVKIQPVSEKISLAYDSRQEHVDALNDESDDRDHEGRDGAVGGALGVVDAAAAVLRQSHLQFSLRTLLHVGGGFSSMDIILMYEHVIYYPMLLR